jgi:hypothetical protein
MSFADLMWLAVGAYAMHILEEYQLDWRNWARTVIKLPVEWSDFYVVNALVIVLGIVCAELVRVPLLALIFPAVMLINGTFFHILPFIAKRGRFSPGLVTAVILFWPIGVACYRAAGSEGKLSTAATVGSLVIGAVLMAYPIVLLKIKDRPYFRQDR